MAGVFCSSSHQGQASFHAPEAGLARDLWVWWESLRPEVLEGRPCEPCSLTFALLESGVHSLWEAQGPGPADLPAGHNCMRETGQPAGGPLSQPTAPWKIRNQCCLLRSTDKGCLGNGSCLQSRFLTWECTKALTPASCVIGNRTPRSWVTIWERTGKWVMLQAVTVREYYIVTNCSQSRISLAECWAEKANCKRMSAKRRNARVKSWKHI